MDSPIAFADTNIPVAIRSALGPYLHLHGGNAHNGAKITTWSWVDQPNLKWFIESAPGHHGQYHIVSAVNRHFTVHQHGANHDNGGEITTWEKSAGSPNVRVSFESTGDGFWKIKFHHSGKCVHVHGGKTDNGTPITQWDYVPQANLKWSFHAAGVHETGGLVAIQSGVGTYMHVHGGHAHNSAKITTWTWVDQPNLKWRIEEVKGHPGHYHICSAADHSFVLHQEGGVSENGAPCSTWDKRSHGHQGNLQVKFEPAGEGWWYIKFVHSGKYAHVHGGKTDNGTPITQWERVDQPNLKWRFFPVK